MNLNEVINEILSSFTSNDLFDSHTIINELITKPEYHLAYLREYPENCTVNQYHGQIAKTISNIPNIKSFGIKIKTHTIYGDISENEVWQKI